MFPPHGWGGGCSSIAKQVRAGGRGGWNHGVRGSGETAGLLPFPPGNRGSSFHLLQKAGPLERPDGSRNSLFSIPATDCPGVVPMATVVLPGSSGSCEEKGHRDLPSGSGPACLLSVGAPPSCSQLGTTPWPLVCTPGISWQGPSLVS